MNEKEQAELEKMHVDKDKIEADTYKTYVDMGVLEPYEVRFLKYGNTLDDIPVPKELELPPVEPVPPPPVDESPDDDADNEPDADDNAAPVPPKPPKKAGR
jgi:hypothetical protein